MHNLLFFSKITLYGKLFFDCCDQFGYRGPLYTCLVVCGVYKVVFVSRMFLPKYFWTENHKRNGWNFFRLRLNTTHWMLHIFSYALNVFYFGTSFGVFLEVFCNLKPTRDFGAIKLRFYLQFDNHM